MTIKKRLSAALDVLKFMSIFAAAPTLGAGLVSISALLLADYLLLPFTQSYGSLQALHICGRNHKAVRFKFGHINRRALYTLFSKHLFYFHCCHLLFTRYIMPNLDILFFFFNTLCCYYTTINSSRQLFCLFSTLILVFSLCLC